MERQIMKRMTTGWVLGAGLLLGLGTAVWAVDGDGQAPFWRGQPGSTRQTWRFDTAATNAAPEVVSNGAGSPEVRVVTNYLSAGWFDTNGVVYGTAQGFWDLGGSNQLVSSGGSLLVTVPNGVSAGGRRYLWVQATVFVESGLFGQPALMISNATQIGSASTQLAEGITYDPDLDIWFGWYRRQTLWWVSDATSSNNLVLRAATVGSLVDTVVVDTMVLAANADTVKRGAGLSLKISKAELLGNDTGPGITFAGLTLTSTNGVTVTTNGETIFYNNANNVDDRLTYSIQDSYGAVASADVLIQAGGATNNSVTVVQLETGVPGPNTNRVTLAGIPHYEYVVQFTTNVNDGPWWNLSTNTAGANGLWTVLDPTATNDYRYYRVATP